MNFSRVNCHVRVVSELTATSLFVIFAIRSLNRRWIFFVARLAVSLIKFSHVGDKTRLVLASAIVFFFFEGPRYCCCCCCCCCCCYQSQYRWTDWRYIESGSVPGSSRPIIHATHWLAWQSLIRLNLLVITGELTVDSIQDFIPNRSHALKYSIEH